MILYVIAIAIVVTAPVKEGKENGQNDYPYIKAGGKNCLKSAQVSFV